MPSDKYRITNAGRSIRHAANHFFSSFNAGSPYPFVSVSPDMAAVMDDSDLSNMDRRSAHNALERARRENLNIKFQELAHALPSLQTVRRPSKTVIVAKSLEFVSNSIQRENNYMNTILQLRKENERLRKQAVANGQAPPPPCSISPPLTPVQETKTLPPDTKEDSVTKFDVMSTKGCVDAKQSTATDINAATTTTTVATPTITATSSTGAALLGPPLPVSSTPATQHTSPQPNLTTTPASYYTDAAPDYEQTFMNYMDPAAMMMNFTPPPAYYASNQFYPPPPPPPPNRHHHYYQQIPAAAGAFPYMSKDPQFFV
ncbi:hypothetical protein BCR43DRAFT_483816 [Syncephalastrum racemosum]|uniref:BHLH domain-containing protein n=1 Tax=Syncephalastrum racemosum TaxID=13706 RepID=A0A1X2HVS6_SYNRA|nr:hypothetical protein BCR43DRAFT_483816 [Syncephalastrum racemosum]